MVQNIGFSLAIITVLMSLAATGVLGRATVVFIHGFAEVLVIANAIRAARSSTLPGLTNAPVTAGLALALPEPLAVAAVVLVVQTLVEVVGIVLHLLALNRPSG